MYNKVKQIKLIDNNVYGNKTGKKANCIQAQCKFAGETERTGETGESQPQ